MSTIYLSLTGSPEKLFEIEKSGGSGGTSTGIQCPQKLGAGRQPPDLSFRIENRQIFQSHKILPFQNDPLFTALRVWSVFPHDSVKTEKAVFVLNSRVVFTADQFQQERIQTGID